VSIAGTGSGRDLVLTVQDNGSGIKPGGRRSGLANLADRAAALDGSMRAEPAADGGTALEWRVPLTGRQ
jgi:signal transduction histidine kinase